MTVRTRFAPSPTGYLHVGGVRTALFAWLYAKKKAGQFILRIEDTDQTRSTQASVDAILEGMNWLGLDYDEGPFYQTERLERYQEVINQLVSNGQAYRCNCSKERLDELREKQMQAKMKPKYDGLCRDKQLSDRETDFVIRFKNPIEGMVQFNDYVYGDIVVANQELDDLIIQKSDGMPTYNLAVVVDDLDMGITDVIRGDDHINNTPRQINLFRALNAEIPRFAHLPMILGDDGKRLSKRHGAVNIMQFKEQGYLPHTMLNYLVRLGWSHGDQEIFSMDDMIELFNLDHISKGGSAFSIEKLNWLNQHYLKNSAVDNLKQQLIPLLEAQGTDFSVGADLSDVIPEYVERCKTLAEMAEKIKYLYQDEVEYDETAVKKHLKDKARAPLQKAVELFQQIQNWQKETIHQAIDQLCEVLEIKMGKVAQPIRVAVTGSTMSPSIDITLSWLGKDKVINRLKQAIEQIPS